MVTTWPPNFPVLGEGCKLFAKWVKEMSEGQMDIAVYGGGELVPPLEAFNTVRSGAAEIGSGAAYYWAGMVPSAQFFASIPFGMNAQQLNAWILCGGGLQLWEECYAELGLVPMVGGNTGVQMGGWFNREINSMDDFKGLKMRMPGLGGKVLKKAGGAAVLLAGSELYTGLERGIIDATEWIGPYHDYKMGFHQIAKYYYSPGWHEAGTLMELFFNKKKFDDLPNHLKVIMQSAAQRLNMWMLSEFETQNGFYLEKILAEGNVEIRKFPDEVLTQLRLYNDEVIQELVDSDPFAKKVYESYNSFRKKAAAWSELTEKAFYNSIQI
jgi:TRAP-type mannitol/chloroaromatic compound transport system substrate-binding protein